MWSSELHLALTPIEKGQSWWGRQKGAPPGPCQLELGDVPVWGWGTLAGLEGTAWDPILGSSTSWLWRLVLTVSFCKCGRDLISLKDCDEKKTC